MPKMLPKDPEDRYRAPALDKGLDILELLAEQSDGMTRAEIVSAMGRSPSEIYRMLERLVAREYVARSAGGDRYTLTMKLFVMSTRYPPTRRMVGQAQPLLDGFARETLQSCHMVMPDRGAAVVVAQASPLDSWEFRVRVGARLDLFDTGSGQTLMAFQSPERRAQTLAIWGLPDALPRLAQLEAELAAVRATGYRVGQSHQLMGVTDLSVPILALGDDAVAVVTCPYIGRPGPAQVASVPETLSRMQGLAAALAFN